jgi:hypothetical protein
MRVPFRALALAALGAAAAVVATAQPPVTTTPAKKAEGQDVVEVRLADGSAVRMTLTQTHIDVTTRYGKLSVPVADVKRIDFGFRYPEGAQAKIEDAVAKLGASNYRQREAAATELLALKELAYPALKRAAQSADAEVVKRAEELLKKIEEKVPAERLKVGENDLIHTQEFTIAGRIDAPVLRARSPYFGDVQVQLAEARSLRALRSGGTVEFTVEPRYASHTEWLETDVEVTADDPLEIKAGGQMLLRPGVGNGYESTPNGNPNYRDGAHMPGQLLGRVGRTGKTFIIGETYRGTPGEAGRLYLRVHPSPWANQMQGSYTAKVTVGGTADGRVPMGPRPEFKPKADATVPAKDK